MKWTKQRLNNLFFFLGCAAVVVMLLTFDVSFIELWEHICHAGYWLIPIIGIWVVVYALNALAWKAMIEGNIGRDPKDRLRMDVFPPDSEIGKPAVTHYRVMERYGYVTLVECILETGRTHQIRAHMKHIGHPLFADERYGGTELLRGERTASYKAYIQNCFKLCPRQVLHARTLGFVHPTTGRQMDFTSEWPDDMSALIDKWRKYIRHNEITS